MKKIIAAVCSVFMITTAIAGSSRTSTILVEDSYDRLQKISEMREILEKNKNALCTLEQEFALEKEKANKQQNSKIIMEAGGAGFAAIGLIVLNMSTGKTKRMGNVIATLEISAFIAAISAVITATGATKYFLNLNDVEALNLKVKLAREATEKSEINITKEILQLCKVDSRHKLCY